MMLLPRGETLVLPRFRRRHLHRRTAMLGIFLAVDGADMRRVVIEIGPADAVALAVGVDPLPQLLGRHPALRARRAIDADDVGREPVAVTAAQAAAMIGAVGRGLQPAGDRLAIIVAEGAGDPRRKSRLLGGVQ